MASKHIAVALLSVALITGGAFAQTDTSKNASGTSAATTEYSAYKLVGVNVYNNGNEKIGEVKDILLERAGRADKAILSVGGFLGLGEHYVAVPYDQVKWVDAGTHRVRQHEHHDGIVGDKFWPQMVSGPRGLQCDQGSVEGDASIRILMARVPLRARTPNLRIAAADSDHGSGPLPLLTLAFSDVYSSEWDKADLAQRTRRGPLATRNGHPARGLDP
jgi:sporulation protein YlmC with PRC-barrel domain